MLKNINILAIDDTPSIRMFLRISLQAQGAIFHEADTALGGLHLCLQIQRDVVVLDLGLPDKNGLDILSALKQVRANGGSPTVIILTVRNEPSVRDKAFQLGADAYLSKPFVMEELVEILHEKLHLSHSPQPLQAEA